MIHVSLAGITVECGLQQNGWLVVQGCQHHQAVLWLQSVFIMKKVICEQICIQVKLVKTAVLASLYYCWSL